MCWLFRGKSKQVPPGKPVMPSASGNDNARTPSGVPPTNKPLQQPPSLPVTAPIPPQSPREVEAISEDKFADNLPKRHTSSAQSRLGQQQQQPSSPPGSLGLQLQEAPSILQHPLSSLSQAEGVHLTPPANVPTVSEPDGGEANSDSGATQLHDRQQQSHNILGQPFQDVASCYTIERKLGIGDFGVTYVCTKKSTGLQYACKSISKRRLMKQKDKEDIKREVHIMRRLAGNPNVVQIEGVYEDLQSVNIIMELCTGGGIFDRIIAKGNISERAAATICRQVVNAVNACHCEGVVIVDLKPESFLFSSKDEGAFLKLKDFRFSVLIEEAKSYQARVQSAYYVAPEVLQRHYGKEIDVWSAGIILYILLSGVPPFKAETEKGILDSISKGHIDFEMKPWPHISSSAVNLVKLMLTKDPRKRITSAQVLENPWIKGGNASNKPIDVAVIDKMKQFRATNEFKKFAPKVIAERLSEEQIKSLKVHFVNEDWNKSGTITYKELKRGLDTFGPKLSETELNQLISAADADGNGTIDYNEFITATLHLHGLERNISL